MEDFLLLSHQTDRQGTYLRKSFGGDVLFWQFNYRDVNCNISGCGKSIRDLVADGLLQEELVSRAEYNSYLSDLRDLIFDQHNLAMSNEALYNKIHGLRIKHFSPERLEQFFYDSHRNEFPVTNTIIDHTQHQRQLMEQCDCIVFFLADPRYLSALRCDLEEACRLQKRIYVAVQSKAGYSLLTKPKMSQLLAGHNRQVEYLALTQEQECPLQIKLEWNAELQKAVDEEKACLFGYGEGALFFTQNLLLPAIVKVVPQCYFARAVTNMFLQEAFCNIYVPRGYNIYPFVKLTEKTVLSYYHLFLLYRHEGDVVYQKTPEELYRRYPSVFINIYDDNPASEFIQWELPTVANQSDSFVQQRCSHIKQLLDTQGTTYLESYFDSDTYEIIPMPERHTQQNDGILITGVLAHRLRQSQVLVVEGEPRSPRELFRERPCNGMGILSNFLYFMTGAVLSVYNELRADRPQEQLAQCGGHIDYLLQYNEGERIETFPLYHKACIGMREDGSLLCFKFLLGGGEMQLGNMTIRWGKEDVNPEIAGAVAVYTPYYCNDSEQEDAGFICPVGAGRVNLAIVNDRIVAARQDEILLPCIGVVVSLEIGYLNQLREQCLGDADPDGYYAITRSKLVLRLDPPEQLSPREWAKMRWCYGGGLMLFEDGKSIFDNDSACGGWLGSLSREGWMNPLSRQTQESAIHALIRHPRTAIGSTKSGGTFILVFSGRTWLSQGADYREMCILAQKLIPDIDCMVNVDGGGSAVLGMVQNDTFMELSYPSTSDTSCAGMARKISTMLLLEI